MISDNGAPTKKVQQFGSQKYKCSLDYADARVDNWVFACRVQIPFSKARLCNYFDFGAWLFCIKIY